MCCKWLKKISWGKVLAATASFAVIDSVLRQVEAFATMKYYLMPEYFTVWSTIMMPKAGPPGVAFFVAAFIGSLLGGLVMALAYYLLSENHLSGNIWQKAGQFTLKMNVILLVFSYYPMWLMVRLPLVLIISWFIAGVVVVFLSALAFAKIFKR